MTDAPERIWAFYAPDIAEDENGATIVAHENVQHGGQEYIRKDIAAAAVLADREAVEPLAQAVDDFGNLKPSDSSEEWGLRLKQCLDELTNYRARTTQDG